MLAVLAVVGVGAEEMKVYISRHAGHGMKKEMRQKR